MPRNLELLVINDEEADIGTDRIELVKCHDGFRAENEIQRIAHWPQHMWLWGKNEIPQFDLLLIDIKFEKDTYDPKYFDEAKNPLGLLHALPIVARQRLTTRPFVWGIHSGQPREVMEDPMAIWAFGLLCAMEQRENWDGYTKNFDAIDNFFSNQIGSLSALSPREAWREMIPRYRSKLIQACREGKVFPDIEWLNELMGKVDTADALEFAELADEAIAIHSNVYDEILLDSLFAEREWHLSLKGEMMDFLTNLRIATGDIFAKVADTIQRVQAGESLKQVCLRAKYDDAIAVSVIVCAWLKRFFDNNLNRGVTNILNDLYIDNTQAARIFGRVGLSSKLSKFFEAMENGHLENMVWRQCGRRYYLDVLNWKRGMKWPSCLGPIP